MQQAHLLHANVIVLDRNLSARYCSGMEMQKANRRLTAILAADVVGYSRMMGQDEARTLGRLTKLRRELIEPLIAGHGGRIVKLMGDGFLVEFPSLVDAVQCAMAWHSEAEVHEVNHISSTAIRFRIGINIGDVLIEGDDIYGDGVNIASRLEALAMPGGTCISADAYRQVRGKVEVEFEDMGDQVLKNIAEPVRVYRLAPHSTENSVAADGADAAALSEQPSIAVLPFTNMSGDQEQEYFADGITEDIITDLSKLRGLHVIARNSSFAYKGKSPDIRQVCRDLGVKYILEGSVRKAGSRARITAQLIDGATGRHIWAERYDKDLADVFAVQDEVTQEIVHALELKLPRAAGSSTRINTANPVAYDLVLRGREQYRRFTLDGNKGARELYEKAIDLDPNYAGAYAGLALTCLHDWFMGKQDALDRAYELAQQSRALDPSLPLAYEALGNVLLFKRQHEEAVAAARQWVKIEPGNADAYANLAAALVYAGEPENVVPLIDKAISLNPYYPFYYTLYKGKAYLQMERYEDALEAFKRSVIHNPETVHTHLLLAASYGLLGHDTLARAEMAEVQRLSPDVPLSGLVSRFAYKRAVDLDRVIEGLRKAGLSD